MNGTLPAAVAALSQVPAVEAVTERFTAAGKRLYAVGGCMRDALALSEAAIDSPDIDFTTDADPDTITAILHPLGAIWDAGARFGTIGVAIPDGNGGYEKIEVTTHRAETYDESSRKPTVMLVTDIDEDLARRDLTINAIALRLTPGPLEVIDPFGGAQDLADRVLRTPSDPRRTLDEDPLRILRVIRFAARFGFTIDPTLIAACIEFAGRLEIVAAERRTDELRKILDLGGQRCVTAFELAEQFGVTSFMLGGVAMTDQLRKALISLGGAGLVVTAVAADSFLNGADGNARLRMCRLTNHEMAPAVTVGRLVASGTLNSSDIVSVRATLRKFGTTVTADAIAVSEAFGRQCGQFASAFAAVVSEHPEVATTSLPVNGDDALAAGLKGRAVGAALLRVEAAFCADPDISRATALALLR